jgi:hypothetical protein
MLSSVLLSPPAPWLKLLNVAKQMQPTVAGTWLPLELVLASIRAKYKKSNVY